MRRSREERGWGLDPLKKNYVSETYILKLPKICLRPPGKLKYP